MSCISKQQEENQIHAIVQFSPITSPKHSGKIRDAWHSLSTEYPRTIRMLLLEWFYLPPVMNTQFFLAL